MLAEAAILKDDEAGPSDRSSKRRRVNLPIDDAVSEGEPVNDDSPITVPSQKLTLAELPQVIDEDFEESNDSDEIFEDVDLEPGSEVSEPDDEAPRARSLEIDLSATTRGQSDKVTQRRKPVSKIEQALRLDVHKWHILCLLLHLRCRNQWCENEQVQATLKPLILRKTISLLHMDESRPQYQRIHSFNKAIEEISVLWREVWQVTVRGMRRANWKEEIDIESESEQLEEPVDFEDFKYAAQVRSGSRDLGAQLFCALLRSVAVETRLVCSLQVLPFSASAKGQTPQKPKPQYIHAPPQSFSTNQSDQATSLHLNPRWRMAEHAGSTAPIAQELQRPKKKIQDSPYPVFWVEVFSPAATMWIPVDPLVRHTINKPKTGFEPPASDLFNNMSYVIAFEEDGSARDVTRRYVHFPNAKTRKARVESTKGGQKWWDQTMNFFRKPFPEDRDFIEDADLAKREAAEPMPKNVQDFKGHPIYVLERHLRQNEVIHPKHEVGKVGTGISKSRNSKLESIYRRRDLHVVRSAEQWYRRGRDVKEGEVGLKRGLRKRPSRAVEDEHSDNHEDDGRMLYAEFQTDLYIPPSVVRGRIPKNVYGNLDVYVPSMIPEGAIHIQHPEAASAAKSLGIDYADAVTGFDFVGRHGTAVLNGVVVAREYREAMVEVIEALEHERIQKAEASKRALILQLWRKFFTAVQIRKKIDDEYAGGENDEEEQIVGSPNEVDDDDTDMEDAGGGFIPDTDEADRPTSDQMDFPLDQHESMPPMNLDSSPGILTYRQIIIVESPHTVHDNLHDRSSLTQGTDHVISTREDPTINSDREPGGFMTDDTSETPAHEPENSIHTTLDESNTEEGGGFLPDDDESNEDTTDPDPHHSPPPPTTTANSSSVTAADLPNSLQRISSVTQQLAGSQSPSDQQSLLSHDPDDEDAEPDWLMDE